MLSGELKIKSAVKLAALCFALMPFVFSCSHQPQDDASQGGAQKVQPSDPQPSLPEISEERTVEDGYFVFSVKGGRAALASLTDEGMEQTVLEVPSKVEVAVALQQGSPGLASKGGDSIEIAVTSIVEGAFEGNGKVETIRLPDTISEIGSGAFKGCSALENINIPDAVEKINSGTFENCSSLRSISLNNVIECDGAAFAGCGLCDVCASEAVAEYLSGILDESVKVSANSASGFFRYSNFVDCVHIIGLTDAGKELETVEIPEEISGVPVVELDFNIFSGSKAKKIVFPSSLSAIGMFSCEGCASVEEIVIPPSVKLIDKFAFRGCGSLRNVQFSEGLESIGLGAFAGCSSLTDLILPYSLKSIDMFAFSDCPIESFLVSDDTGYDSLIGFDESMVSYRLPSKYVYEENEDGLTLNGLRMDLIGSDEKVFRIPSAIRKTAITEIGDNADFSGCPFEHIDIPSSVDRIGHNAFTSCEALRSVSIHKKTHYEADSFSPGVEISVIGLNAPQGDVQDYETIFEYFMYGEDTVAVGGIKRDVVLGSEPQTDICVPYKVNGNFVVEIIIGHLLSEISDWFGESGDSADVRIYLPVDSRGENHLLDMERLMDDFNDWPNYNPSSLSFIEHVKLLSYYCPALDEI